MIEAPPPIAPPVAIVAPAQAAAASLDALRWNRRILIVSAPRRDNPALLRQRQLLDRAAMADRDLHVVEIVGDTVSGVGDDAARLRRRYAIPVATFETLLIGKDGGVKLRRFDAVPMTLLNDTIDAMPMRRAEAARR